MINLPLAALGASLLLAWLNFLLTGKWAALPGALNGWRQPWYAAALIAATVLTIAARRRVGEPTRIGRAAAAGSSRQAPRTWPVTTTGTGRLRNLDFLGGEVELTGVAAGTPVRVRANYYPAWRARVGGRDVPPHSGGRADRVRRARRRHLRRQAGVSTLPLAVADRHRRGDRGRVGADAKHHAAASLGCRMMATLFLTKEVERCGPRGSSWYSPRCSW